MQTANRISALRTANLRVTDKRIKLTNELLQGIRAIKSYNWETPFADQLRHIRDEELRGLQNAANMHYYYSRLSLSAGYSPQSPSC